MGIASNSKQFRAGTYIHGFPASTAMAKLPYMNAMTLLRRTASSSIALVSFVAISSATSLSQSLSRMPPPSPPVNAPEIAPELLAGALVLVVGGLFILTDRMRRQVRA